MPADRSGRYTSGKWDRRGPCRAASWLAATSAPTVPAGGGSLEGRNGVEEPRKRLDAPLAGMVLGSAPMHRAGFVAVALGKQAYVNLVRWIIELYQTLSGRGRALRATIAGPTTLTGTRLQRRTRHAVSRPLAAEYERHTQS
jgi:hypothetical protein